MAYYKTSINKIILQILFLIIFCFPDVVFSMAEDKIEKTYDLNKNGKVYLKNISGNITITSWDKDVIKINAHKIARDEADLSNTTINIHDADGSISIITKHQKKLSLSRSKHVSVHYTLIIPSQTQIKVETVSGNIDAREIGGFLETRSISGEIKIVGAYNGVKSKSISGNIYLEEVAGNIDQRTTSGEIIVERIKGAFEADTVSGDIDLKAVSFANKVEVVSIAGNIKLHGDLNPTGIYELTSHSGYIRLDIPKGSNFELQTKTFSGELYFDFELKIFGEVKRQKFQGIAGKGGASLILSSFSGDIRIDKQ